MSRPLDTKKKHSFEHSFSPTTQLSPLRVGCLVTPGRPPKVPFFRRERYVFMFLCEKNVPVDTLLIEIELGLTKRTLCGDCVIQIEYFF